MSGYFANRTAVVTGAASGIGAALTHALCEVGARVIACDVDEPALLRLRARANGAVSTEPLDVTDPEAVEALAAKTARGAPIDFWFNNAGIAVGGEILDLSADDWRRVLDVNLLGVVHGVRAAYPRMVERGSGHIVNVASISGLAPFALALPYTTSKHGVVGLSLALRAEAAPRGVRVSVVCPGTIETPIWHRSPVRGVAPSARLRERLSRGMSAERCARLILRAVRRNRGLTTITGQARAMWILQRLSPALSVRLHQGIASWVRARAGLRAPATTSVVSPP